MIKTKSKIKQALYLAAGLLLLYFPITIYVNMPKERILSEFTHLFAPALVTLIFYLLLILIIEQLLDYIIKLFGENALIEFRLPVQLISLPVAILATLFSNLLFVFSFQTIGKFFIPNTEIQKPADAKQKLTEIMTIEQWENLKRTNNGLTVVIVLSIFYLSVNRRANNRIKQIELQAEQLKKETALAQFEALKNQISPHFLFNSLSILSSLVHVDPALSEKFIDQLSKAYRYILEQKDNDSISLKKELDFIYAYVFLLKIRFEKKFEVEVTVSEKDAEKFQIAPLTLQLLVENAVKHNRMSTNEPLFVRILLEDSYLVVMNEFKPRNQKGVSTGIGLENIVNRYKLLTAKPVEIINAGGEFKVKIPLLS